MNLRFCSSDKIVSRAMPCSTIRASPRKPRNEGKKSREKERRTWNAIHHLLAFFPPSVLVSCGL